MDVLVLVRQDAAPVSMPIERLRHELDVGMAPREVPVSLDGGQSWIPGWQATGLSAPGSGNDTLRYVVPVGRSIWAIVTGYLGLVTAIVDLLLLFLVVGTIGAREGRMGVGEALVVTAGALAIGAPAQVVTALLARRSLKNDPKLLGKGRVTFTLLCVGLLLVLLLVYVVASIV